MEIQNVDYKTIRLRTQDPGTATLVLVVRNIDAALDGVRRANVPIVTPGGKPVTFADGTRAMLIRDVDNRFIEIRQPAAVTFPPPRLPRATSSTFDCRSPSAIWTARSRCTGTCSASK